jgi:uncharacterized protein (DUF58 family)
MTYRARGVIILLLLSVAAALVSGREIFANLSYFWSGLLVMAYVWSKLSLRGVQISRNPRSNRAQVGQLFVERFEVENRSKVPKLWLETRDESDLPGYPVTAIAIGLGLRGPAQRGAHQAVNVAAGLGPAQIRTWILRTLCTMRGRYGLGPMIIASGDPFGLFPVEKRIPAQQHVVVLPMIVPLQSFPLPSGRLPGGEALRRRTHHITPNASGVREYAPGDSYSRIHWRSTARLGQLMVKEFELDPLAEIWIVLDAQRGVQFESNPPADSQQVGIGEEFQLPYSSFEYCVTAAASLAVHFLLRDRSVGLITYADQREVIQPEFGEAQQWRLLEALAVVNAGGDQTLPEVLKIETPRIPQGATVIVISPSADTGLADGLRWLAHAGREPVLVHVERDGSGGQSEGADLLAAVQHSRIPARRLRFGEDLEASLSSGTPFVTRRRVA